MTRSRGGAKRTIERQRLPVAVAQLAGQPRDTRLNAVQAPEQAVALCRLAQTGGRRASLIGGKEATVL